MENYDVFGDDLGSGMLDGLVGLGSSDGFGAGSGQQQQPPRPGATDTMMQGFNSQASQYAPMGQGMAPAASKLTPGGYPDFSSQYGAYNPSTVQQQQAQASLGAYGSAPGAPSRPMAGYPPYHQSAATPSIHYQDYSVQSQAGMLRPTAPPTQPHASAASRMVSPAAPPPPQQQQQYGAYRAPSQDSMYVQQLQRWNEQQPYGASLPHHYPANAAATYRPPHAYPSNLPRPPQPMPQQNSIQQQQPQTAPSPSAASVNSQQPSQHNIPYMTRPQTPSVLSQQQSQYTQNMYPNASNQYPDYHHNSANLNRMGSGPTGAPSNVYPTASHHTQQPYSMPTAPQPHQPYGNQYGQYYPTGSSQVSASQGNSMSYSGSYGSSAPAAVNSSVPNGNTSYRPGYAQLPQLSPRQPTPSPRQPTPSPRPPAATTPTIPVPTSQQQPMPQPTNTMPQQQQQPPPPQLPPVVPPQQNQQPSSLQQLEQMVMPHVSKSCPSPKPNMVNMAGGVMSPLGGPKTPMSPQTISGPKTPMSPTQWQTPSRPSQQPPPVSKPSYPPTPQQQTPSMSGSPGGYSMSPGVMSPMQNATSNSIDNTINSIVRNSQDPTADLDLGNLSSSMDASECPLPASITSRSDDTKSSSQMSSGSMPSQNQTPDMTSLQNTMTDEASSGATSEMSTTDSMGQAQNNSVQSTDTGFSLPGSSLHDSAIDSDGTSGLPSLGSSMDDSQASQPQVTNSSSSSLEPNVPSSMSNALNSMSPSSSQAQQQQQMSSTFTSPALGSPMASMAPNAPSSSQSSQQQQQQMGLPPSSSQSSMQVSNMISSYNSQGPQQQQQHVQASQGYVNSTGMNSAPTSMVGMMPPPGPHQYSTQRFPGPDVSGASQSYMGGYHNAPGYPQYPTPGQSGVHQGQMRPPVPSPYGPVGGMGPNLMGAQGMPNQGAPPAQGSDRYYEIHQLQQQLQHLFSLPMNPQLQMQVSSLHNSYQCFMI